MNRIINTLIVNAGASLLVAGFAQAGSLNQAHVTFDTGNEGWSLNGWDQVTMTGGNPGNRLHWDDFIDNFGMSARNDSSAAFLGDYTKKGPVTLSIDFQVNYIAFFGSPVPRDLVVILYDDDAFEGAPPAHVWQNLGTLNGAGMPWTTFSAEVTDVFSDELPKGWNGGGDEDPKTFEPVLPAGRTWANVLQGVDRIEFTTFVPGFFFGFTNFNLSIDNVKITPQGVTGDLNGDLVVDGVDLGILLGSWSIPPRQPGCGGAKLCPADLNGDGLVNGVDLGILLAAWTL